MQGIKFTPVTTEYKGNMYTIPLPVFDVNLQYQDRAYDFSMYLDTGSNGTMLFPFSANLVNPGFVTEDKLPFIDVTLNHFGTATIAQPKRIRLDYDARLGESFEKPIVAGIIGTDFLKQYALHINYAQSSFFLLPAGTPALPLTCRYVFENNFLFLYASLLGARLKLLFDTGCGGGMLLFEKGFSKVQGHTLKPGSREYAQGAFGATYYYDSYDEEVVFDFGSELMFKTGFGVQQKHPVSDTLDCDGILGNQLFSDRQIIIDYPAQVFSFV